MLEPVNLLFRLNKIEVGYSSRAAIRQTRDIVPIPVISHALLE